MSPEQVEGNSKKIGPRSDIYSLGAVLYQMLTMRLPFQGSLTSVLRKVCNTEPPKPSSIAPEIGVNHPLERICLKMMSKKIEKRYASMADVVAALEGRLLLDDTTLARPSLFKRISGWLFGGRSKKTEESAKLSKDPASKPPSEAPDSSDKSAALSQTVEVTSTDLEDKLTGSKTMLASPGAEVASDSNSKTLSESAVGEPMEESDSRTVHLAAGPQGAAISESDQLTTELPKKDVLASQTVELPAKKQ
jgi:serine/threonine protein kinase